MSKNNIRPKFECQNRSDFACQNSIFGPSSNIKIGFWMSRFDIRPHFECQNSIFGLSSNGKIEFRMSKCDIRPEFECRKTKSEKRKTN